jgi:hypothetical protein
MRPIKPITIPVSEKQDQPVKASLKSLEGDLDILVDSINQGLSATVTQAAIGTLPNHADDTAAGLGGVSVGSMYRTGSIIKVRVA